MFNPDDGTERGLCDEIFVHIVLHNEALFLHF